MDKIEPKLIKQAAKPSIPEKVVAANPFKSSSHLLPRQGWQNRKAYIKTIMKAKAALEIIELDFFKEI